MAVCGKFEGVLIGYDEYTKDGKMTSQYYVLITQKQDKETNLYSACELVTIREENEKIPKTYKKYGQPVQFYGEFKKMANGGFMVYSGIEVKQ